MSARHHADQRKNAAQRQAGEQPAASDGRCTEPAESHDERGRGDMAADKRTVLLALIGRDEGRRELLVAAELLDIDRSRPSGMLLQRRIDQQDRTGQCAGEQESVGQAPRPDGRETL